MIILKTVFKKAVSFLLCLSIIWLAALPSLAAGVTYPQGVTEQTAEQSIDKTDILIKNVLKHFQNTTLDKLVMPMLYSDETLSSILVGIYSSFGEQENALSVLGVDVSTKNVASALTAYPSVSQALSSASDWNSVNLDGAAWNVSDKTGFKNALASMFTPLDELIYVIMCSGTYRRGFITVKGDDGYQNGIVPMLDALGCTEITSNSQFKADADADRSTMIKNIVDSVFSLLDRVLAAPAKTLCEIGPNIAYFMNNGGMDDCMNALINPLKVGIGGYINLFSGSSLSSLMGGNGEGTADGESGFSSLLSSFTSSGDMKLAELDTELLASCGTVQNGKVVANKGEAYVVLFSWLLETAKMNKDSLLSEFGGEEAEQMKPVIDSLFNKNTDEILALLVELLTKQEGTDTEYQWAAPAFTPGSVTYTPNLTKDNFQKVVDGIDKTMSEFIAESGEYKSISQAVKVSLFSSGTVTALVSMLYGQLSSDEMKDAAKLLSLPSSPAAFASSLGSEYYRAKAVLSQYSSWEKAGKAEINWGFAAGDSKSFEKALVAVLSPLEPMLNMLLRGGKIELLGAISFCGTSGYNTAVIPMLEAFGCPSESIKTYAEFKADESENVCVKNIVAPIVALMNKIAEKPIYTLTEILPNMICFLSDGSLTQCINNLLVPVTDLLNKLSVSTDQLGLDKLQNLDILSEVSSMIPDMMKDSMKLPAPDLKKLGPLGQLETIASKRTYQGNPVDAYYVKADQPAVMVTLLRYFVTGMKDPENADFLTGMMAGNSSEGGGNNMFETYSSNIGSEMEKMTVDETIEWLYKLFFRDRAVSNTVGNEDYTPTIIYVESKKSAVGKVIFGILVVLLLAAAVVCIIKREVIFDRLEERRQQKLKKKHEAEIEQYRLEIRRRYLEEQEKLKAQQAAGQGTDGVSALSEGRMFSPQSATAGENFRPQNIPQTDDNTQTNEEVQ